jgi:ubiquinone/menaquinone biosynthesis C-methylase UbiE
MMTKDHPHSVTGTWHNRHDYLPAAGHDLLLPGYDLLTRLLGMRPAYRALVDQAELYGGAQVLEIGCGTGNLTLLAKRAESGADVTGLDPDPRALVRARKKGRRLTGLRFEQGYAQKLPYGDGSFDRVLSSMMLHHLEADAKAAALAEAFRVLRPGGGMHIVDVVGHRRAMAHDVDVIPDLLRSTGFEGATLGSRRLRMVGPVTFYRGLRHA